MSDEKHTAAEELSEPEQSQIEWCCWREFCQQFAELTTLDINDEDCGRMVAILNRWGEELSELRRLRSDPEESSLVLEQRRAAAPVVGQHVWAGEHRRLHLTPHRT